MYTSPVLACFIVGVCFAYLFNSVFIIPNPRGLRQIVNGFGIICIR